MILFHPGHPHGCQTYSLVLQEIAKNAKLGVRNKNIQPYAKLAIIRHVYSESLAMPNILHNFSWKLYYPGRKFWRMLGLVWRVPPPSLAKSDGDLRLEQVSDETDEVRQGEGRHSQDRGPEEINRYTHTHSKPICCVWTPNTSELAWKRRKYVLSKFLCTVWAISILALLWLSAS